MTNEIENLDEMEEIEEALTPAGKLVVFTTAALLGVGTYFVTDRIVKRIQLRQAEKNAEDEN